MVVALNGIVEGVYAQIEHAIVRVSVLMDDLIDRAWIIVRREVFRRNEMALVEIAVRTRIKNSELDFFI